MKLERHDLIPMGPLRELAEHYGKGAQKYADHQWRKGYEWSKSYSSIQRHLRAFWSGEDFDVCSNDPEGCAFLLADGEVVSVDRRAVSLEFIGDRVGALRINDRTFELGPMPIGPDVCYNHTGSHHMVAVAWHSFTLLEFKDTWPEHDDRYIFVPLEHESASIDLPVHDHDQPEDYCRHCNFTIKMNSEGTWAHYQKDKHAWRSVLCYNQKDPRIATYATPRGLTDGVS